MFSRLILTGAIASIAALAQDAAPAKDPAQEPQKDAQKAAIAEAKAYLVEPGTHIPISMINSVSTKNSVPGDPVYFETVFPILVDGRIVIPPGSWVMGTITQVQRPGRVKGRGEFHLRFDSLTLPNGTTRDFRARVSGLDGRASEELDRKEGSIKSEGNKAGDTRTVAETAAAGASVGALAGSASGAAAMGAGIGAAAGAAAGLVGILVTRGPDAVLAKGTTLEMVLDRQVKYDDTELDFSHVPPRNPSSGDSGPLPSAKSKSATRRFPLE
jgi:type IV secretory pathway VirB10-like protein